MATKYKEGQYWLSDKYLSDTSFTLFKIEWRDAKQIMITTYEVFSGRNKEDSPDTWQRERTMQMATFSHLISNHNAMLITEEEAQKRLKYFHKYHDGSYMRSHSGLPTLDSVLSMMRKNI